MIKKLTKSQFSPTDASTKRKITDELKHNEGGTKSVKAVRLKSGMGSPVGEYDLWWEGFVE